MYESHSITFSYNIIRNMSHVLAPQTAIIDRVDLSFRSNKLERSECNKSAVL